MGQTRENGERLTEMRRLWGCGIEAHFQAGPETGNSYVRLQAIHSFTNLRRRDNLLIALRRGPGNHQTYPYERSQREWHVKIEIV